MGINAAATNSAEDVSVTMLGNLTATNSTGIYAQTQVGGDVVVNYGGKLTSKNVGIYAVADSFDHLGDVTANVVGEIISTSGSEGIHTSVLSGHSSSKISLARADFGQGMVESIVYRGELISGARIRVGQEGIVHARGGVDGQSYIDMYNVVDIAAGSRDIKRFYSDDVINNFGVFTHTGGIDQTHMSTFFVGHEFEVEMEDLSQEDRNKIYALVPNGEGRYEGPLTLTVDNQEVAVVLADMGWWDISNLNQIIEAGDTTGINNINNYAGSTFNSGTEIILMDPDVADSAGTIFNYGNLSPGDVEERLLFEAVKDDGGTELLAEVWTAGILTTQLTGDFVQTETGTFTVNIDTSSGASDKLEILSGTATLDGRVFVLPSAYRENDLNRYVILTTDGGSITGEMLVPLFSEYDADYSTDNEVALVFSKAPTYAEVVKSENQKALVEAVLPQLQEDSDIIANLHRIVAEADVRAAYDALSGEMHPSVSGLLMEDGGLRNDAVQQRLHALVDRDERTSYGLLADAQAAAEGALAALGPSDWWFEARGSLLERDGNTSIGTAELEHEATGFLIGADHSNEGWTIGVAGGQTSGETDIDDLLSDADTETWSFGMYGSGRIDAAQDLPLHLSFGAFGNWHSIDTNRTVAFDDFHEDLVADYDASSFQAFAEIGTHVEVTDDLFVHPFASVSHISMETDGFTETAVGDGTDEAALTAEDTSQSLTTTTLGLRSGIEVDLGEDRGRLKLRSMVGWRHNFGDIEPETEFAFAESDKFTITGSPIAEDALITEFSIRCELAPGITFAAIYRGQLGEDSQAHSLQANFSGRF